MIIHLYWVSLIFKSISIWDSRISPLFRALTLQAAEPLNWESWQFTKMAQELGLFYHFFYQFFSLHWWIHSWMCHWFAGCVLHSINSMDLLSNARISGSKWCDVYVKGRPPQRFADRNGPGTRGARPYNLSTEASLQYESLEWHGISYRYL